MALPGVAQPTDTSQPAQDGAQGLAEPADRTDGRDKSGRFAKGNWGNRGGGSKPNKTGSLSKALDGIVDRDELARVLWNLALGKDRFGRKYARPNLSVQMAAVQYVYDRLEGKPLLQLRHETDDLPTFIIMHGRDAKAAGELVEGEAKDVTAPEGTDAHIDLDVNRAGPEE